MKVRPARSADLPAAADALAGAFAGDPPMRWFLADAPGRVETLKRYFRATLPRLHLRYGELWICEQPLGAAAWFAPGSWPLPSRAQLAVLPASLRAFGRHPRRAIAGQAELDRGHPHHIPHWYLDYIGVAPGAQGGGAGSALLRAKLEQIDAEGAPTYLNAGSPRSRDLYRRHGFEVTEEFRLPDGGPPLWRMWRKPGSYSSVRP